MPQFDRDTTTDQAASALADQIRGKVLLMTGASPVRAQLPPALTVQGSLAVEASKAIVKHSPGLLILAGRSQSKLDESVAELRKIAPDVNLRTLILDLGSIAAARKGAQEVLAYSEPIDVLINSAGIMAVPWSKSPDGHEQHFGACCRAALADLAATNHLGPFAFTEAIMPRLLASSAPRVIVVSSSAFNISAVRFDDINFKDGKDCALEP